MKKYLFLTLIFSALFSTTMFAQAGDEPKKSMLEQMKEKQKAPMVAKTGLTEAQADRVIEINYEIRMSAPKNLKDLNEEDRSAKLAEMKAEKERKYSEIPLTADQIKSVYAFFDGMRKDMPQRPSN